MGQELKVSLQTLSTNPNISTVNFIEDIHRHIMLSWYLADLSRGESDEVDLAVVCAGGQSLLCWADTYGGDLLLLCLARLNAARVWRYLKPG